MYESSEDVPRHAGRKLRSGRLPVAVYLQPEMYDALKARALRTDRSMAYVIERALRRHLREERKAA
jgi:predicted DNA-binding protein